MCNNHSKQESSGLSVALIVFLTSQVSCFLPKLLSNTKMIRKYFPIVNVFSAGLQLATIIVDLFVHMDAKTHVHNFSPYISIGLCFLILLAIDVMFLHNDSHSENTKESTNKHKGCNHSHHHESETQSYENLGTCNTSAIAKSKTRLQALLLLFGISVHSFLEGLAINPTLKNQSRLFGLITHKVLESFSIGASIEQSVFSLVSKTMLITFYSILTPSAILIKNFESIKSIENVEPWLNALCIGSLMFVVFFEVIGHSFHGGKDKMKKLFSIFLGYGLGCWSIISAHKNEHHHHH